MDESKYFEAVETLPFQNLPPKDDASLLDVMAVILGLKKYTGMGHLKQNYLVMSTFKNSFFG